MSYFLLFLSILLTLSSLSHAFIGLRSSLLTKCRQQVRLQAQQEAKHSWIEVVAPAKKALQLTAAAAMVLSLGISPSYGGEKVLAKEFEVCLSKCIFEETKPPPVGASVERLTVTRPRGEIIRDCKKQCATSPEQLLLGSPKKHVDPSTPTSPQLNNP
eukprot:gene3244-3553_t